MTLDTATKVERVDGMALAWVNARRVEVGLAPLTGLLDGSFLDHFPGLNARVSSDVEEADLLLTHNGEEIKCKIPKILNRLRGLIVDEPVQVESD